MYLKEIEIQGFKSFADKTKVVFDQGVTAVVGPNGSGKSNITESLRWALGESSVKSLRGGKMPDVIFAGTESRKPLNYASVVVTLDNNDEFIKDAGQEIRVERHIYRSGDSEYKIDISRTCIDRCLNDLQEEIQLCSSRILRREFDHFKLRTGIGNMLLNSFQNLFLALIELILAVNRTGSDKDVNLWILSVLEGLVTSINIRFDRACQTSYRCFLQDFGNLLNCCE